MNETTLDEVIGQELDRAEEKASDKRSQAGSVDGEALLKKIENFVTRYVVLPEGLPLVVALWVMGTYVFEIFDCFPYLLITSPTKRCGKTRLGEVLDMIAANPCRTTGITEAALFRFIETDKPTLIIDEAESLSNKKSERSQAILSILNAGYREGGKVLRCAPRTHEVCKFDTYCPKVVIAIGLLPDTIRDRSIIVSMQRRAPGESVDRFIMRLARREAEPLQDEISQTVQDAKEELSKEYEIFPEMGFLEDREEESWRSLFVLCSTFAPSRVQELKAVSLAISKQKAILDTDDSWRLRLLSDIRAISGDAEAIPTERLLKELWTIPDAPWADPPQITDRKLASLLKPFEISPSQIWIDGANVRGYRSAQFAQAFARYLPP